MKKADRQKVFEKYGGKCAYCGCDLAKGWHLDHKDPVKRIYKGEHVAFEEVMWNGEKRSRQKWVIKYKGMENPHLDTVENSMPACAKCNINKHGDSVEQFRRNIQKYLDGLNSRIVQYQMAKKYGLVEETEKPVVFYFETLPTQTKQPGMKTVQELAKQQYPDKPDAVMQFMQLHLRECFIEGYNARHQWQKVEPGWTPEEGSRWYVSNGEDTVLARFYGSNGWGEYPSASELEFEFTHVMPYFFPELPKQ